MALVRLRNDWFGPHGHFLFRGDREVPDQYLDQLPPHAQVLDDEGNPVKPKPVVVAEPEVVPPVETVSEDKPDDAPKTVRRRAAPSSE